MKWNKINTVKQVSEDGKYMTRKLFEQCFVVIKTDDDNFDSPIFHTIKEAKKFAEDFAAKENA